MGHRGFTLIEIVIVIGVMGIIVAIGVPLLGGLVSQGQVRGARRQVATHVARARSVAVRRGCPAVLRFDPSNARVWLTTCGATGAGIDTIGAIDDLSSRYGVALQATNDSVYFGPHGLAVAGSATTLDFSNVRHGLRLDISPVGRVSW